MPVTLTNYKFRKLAKIVTLHAYNANKQQINALNVFLGNT